MMQEKKMKEMTKSQNHQKKMFEILHVEKSNIWELNIFFQLETSGSNISRLIIQL